MAYWVESRRQAGFFTTGFWPAAPTQKRAAMQGTVDQVVLKQGFGFIIGLDGEEGPS